MVVFLVKPRSVAVEKWDCISGIEAGIGGDMEREKIWL